MLTSMLMSSCLQIWTRENSDNEYVFEKVLWFYVHTLVQINWVPIMLKLIAIFVRVSVNCTQLYNFAGNVLWVNHLISPWKYSRLEHRKLIWNGLTHLHFFFLFFFITYKLSEFVTMSFSESTCTNSPDVILCGWLGSKHRLINLQQKLRCWLFFVWLCSSKICKLGVILIWTLNLKFSYQL